MDQLLDAVTEVATLASREKVRAIADRIRNVTSSSFSSLSLSDFASTPKAMVAIEQLKAAWWDTNVSSNELAAMLMSASHTYNKLNEEQTIELVWTGPTTPFVSARRTEQALLQVLKSAREALFITSFVAYDVSSIVKALNALIERDVRVSMLLESSHDHGGSMSIDVIGKMRELVPGAMLYAWTNKTGPYLAGRVHAKVVLADSHCCFITSANLTGFAMEKNMEAGILINGGRIPALLNRHLNAFIDLKLIELV
jgi:cardiolipin synthase